MSAATNYVRNTSSNITSSEANLAKKLSKGKTSTFDPRKPKRITIYAAKKFPTWQEKYIDLVREAFDAINISIDDKELNAKVGKLGERWMTSAEENDQNIMALQLRMSGFTAYSILANLNACIIESRAIVETELTKSNFTNALIRWYSTYPPEIDPDAIDPFHSGILWHFSFMILFVNPVTLEQALGRDGASASENAVANLRQWSNHHPTYAIFFMLACC